MCKRGLKALQIREVFSNERFYAKKFVRDSIDISYNKLMLVHYLFS